MTAKPQRTGGGHRVRIHRNWKALFIAFPGNYIPASAENLFWHGSLGCHMLKDKWISTELIDFNDTTLWKPFTITLTKKQLLSSSHIRFSADTNCNSTTEQQERAVAHIILHSSAMRTTASGKWAASIFVSVCKHKQNLTDVTISLPGSSDKILYSRLIFMKAEGFSEHGLHIFCSKTRTKWVTHIISKLSSSL